MEDEEKSPAEFEDDVEKGEEKVARASVASKLKKSSKKKKSKVLKKQHKPKSKSSGKPKAASKCLLCLKTPQDGRAPYEPNIEVSSWSPYCQVVAAVVVVIVVVVVVE